MLLWVTCWHAKFEFPLDELVVPTFWTVSCKGGSVEMLRHIRKLVDVCVFRRTRSSSAHAVSAGDCLIFSLSGIMSARIGAHLVFGRSHFGFGTKSSVAGQPPPTSSVWGYGYDTVYVYGMYSTCYSCGGIMSLYL